LYLKKIHQHRLDEMTRVSSNLTKVLGSIYGLRALQYYLDRIQILCTSQNSAFMRASGVGSRSDDAYFKHTFYSFINLKSRPLKSTPSDLDPTVTKHSGRANVEFWRTHENMNSFIPYLVQFLCEKSTFKSFIYLLQIINKMII
jgi:hypothetical protein